MKFSNEEDRLMERWISKQLQSLHVNNPDEVAKYIMSVLRCEEKTGSALRTACIEEFKQFVKDKTVKFVDSLCGVLRDGSYKDVEEVDYDLDEEDDDDSSSFRQSGQRGSGSPAGSDDDDDRERRDRRRDSDACDDDRRVVTQSHATGSVTYVTQARHQQPYVKHTGGPPVHNNAPMYHNKHYVPNAGVPVAHHNAQGQSFVPPVWQQSPPHTQQQWQHAPPVPHHVTGGHDQSSAYPVHNFHIPPPMHTTSAPHWAGPEHAIGLSPAPHAPHGGYPPQYLQHPAMPQPARPAPMHSNAGETYQPFDGFSQHPQGMVPQESAYPQQYGDGPHIARPAQQPMMHQSLRPPHLASVNGRPIDNSGEYVAGLVAPPTHASVASGYAAAALAANGGGGGYGVPIDINTLSSDSAMQPLHYGAPMPQQQQFQYKQPLQPQHQLAYAQPYGQPYQLNPKAKPFVGGRGGGAGGGGGREAKFNREQQEQLQQLPESERLTLKCTGIPSYVKEEAVRAHFASFGHVVELQLMPSSSSSATDDGSNSSDKQTFNEALIQFHSAANAKKCFNSPAPVLNNRFIKLVQSHFNLLEPADVESPGEEVEERDRLLLTKEGAAAVAAQQNSAAAAAKKKTYSGLNMYAEGLSNKYRRPAVDTTTPVQKGAEMSGAMTSSAAVSVASEQATTGAELGDSTFSSAAAESGAGASSAVVPEAGATVAVAAPTAAELAVKRRFEELKALRSQQEGISRQKETILQTQVDKCRQMMDKLEGSGSGSDEANEARRKVLDSLESKIVDLQSQLRVVRQQIEKGFAAEAPLAAGSPPPNQSFIPPNSSGYRGRGGGGRQYGRGGGGYRGHAPSYHHHPYAGGGGGYESSGRGRGGRFVATTYRRNEEETTVANDDSKTESNQLSTESAVHEHESA